MVDPPRCRGRSGLLFYYGVDVSALDAIVSTEQSRLSPKVPYTAEDLETPDHADKVAVVVEVSHLGSVLVFVL